MKPNTASAVLTNRSDFVNPYGLRYGWTGNFLSSRLPSFQSSARQDQARFHSPGGLTANEKNAIIRM